MAKKVLSEAQRERARVKRVKLEVHRPIRAPKTTTTQPHHRSPRNLASVNLSYDDTSEVQPKGCPNCAGLKEEDRCILRVSRKRLSDMELEQLKGALFTCADTDDVFSTTQKASFATYSLPSYHSHLSRMRVSGAKYTHLEIRGILNLNRVTMS
jgi:hypothetical protein